MTHNILQKDFRNPLRLINGDVIGPRGNAFAVLGNCITSAREFGLSEDWIEAFFNEVQGGNYDHFVSTVEKHFSTF